MTESIDIFIVADAAAWDEAAGCAEAAAAGTRLAHRLVVVARSEPSARDAERLRAAGVAEVRSEASAAGAAALRNLALRSSAAEFVVLLDARALPQGEWLEPLVRAAREDARVGAAGGVSVHPDTDKVLQAGVRLGEDLHPLYHGREEFQEFFDASSADPRPPAVSGHCLLVRRDAALEAGGFDEGYRGEFDDVDFCLRLRARGRAVALSTSSVAHHREPSRLDGLPHRRENLDRLARLVRSSDVLMELARGGDGGAADAPARPLVSLLYPAYNDVAFLEENIESIINQTYRNWELVVVNDASTDETPQILEAYAAAYPGRVRVLHMGDHNRLETWELGGAHSRLRAWELGYAATRGKYLALLGADDVLLQGCVAKQVRALESAPSAAFAYGDAYRFDDDGLLIDYVNVDAPEPGRQLAHFMRANYVFTPSVLMRRSLIDESGGWLKDEFMYAQDYDLWLRLLHGREKRHVGRPLIKYRMHRAQMTAKAGRANMFKYAADVLRDKLTRWPAADFFPALDLDTPEGHAAALREVYAIFNSPQTVECDVQPDVLRCFADVIERRAAAPEARRTQRALHLGAAAYFRSRGRGREAARHLWQAARAGAVFERELYGMLWHKARRALVRPPRALDRNL